MIVGRAVAFVTHPRLYLDRNQPPRPPWRREHGPYCFQATCYMEDAQGNLEASVRGYDKYVEIQDAVVNACRIDAKGRPGVTCSSPQLTLMREYRKECAGQVYLYENGTTRRLL